MQEYPNHIAWWMLSTFCAISARKKKHLFTETMPRNRPKVWRKSTTRKASRELRNILNERWNNYWIRISCDVKNYAVNNNLFYLHNSSHHTQPYLIIVEILLIDSNIDSNWSRKRGPEIGNLIINADKIPLITLYLSAYFANSLTSIPWFSAGGRLKASDAMIHWNVLKWQQLLERTSW